MADETPAPDAAAEVAAEKKQGNPLIPALIFAILTPGLTFAVAQFMIVPQIKAAMGLGGGAHGAEHAAAGGNHGGGGHGEATHATSFEFNDIVANLSESLQSRYIKVSFTVEGTNADMVEIIEGSQAKYIDTVLTILSSLTLKDLEAPGIKNLVRNDLLASFDEISNGLIEHIYFSEFVVQ